MTKAGWQPVVAEPLKAVALLLILLLLSTLSIALPAAGGTKCPAAVSATVITSSCMVSGGTFWEMNVVNDGQCFQAPFGFIKHGWNIY